jgi:hypothetical protein
MPSRPITIAIIAFWLSTAGWFVVRDLVPAWRSGEPPPYTIEMADEALPQVVRTRWSCTLNGQSIGGELFTVFASKPDDYAYELTATCKQFTMQFTFPIGPVRILVQDYVDRIRISQDGELRSIATTGSLVAQVAGLRFEGRFERSAEVRHGRLERHVVLEADGLGKYSPDLPPTDPPHGSVLNPMHPLPRISGLRAGQTWRQPLVDPRVDMLQAVCDQMGLGKLTALARRPEMLLAVVLPELQSLRWENQDQPCLVIEFRDGEECVARTWVRQSDGMVLRQEAGGHGEKLMLQRE